MNTEQYKEVLANDIFNLTNTSSCRAGDAGGGWGPQQLGVCPRQRPRFSSTASLLSREVRVCHNRESGEYWQSVWHQPRVHDRFYSCSWQSHTCQLRLCRPPPTFVCSFRRLCFRLPFQFLHTMRHRASVTNVVR